jgi:hypothetical protein
MSGSGNNGPNMKIKKRANGTLVEDYGENHPKKAFLVMGHGGEGWKLRVPYENSDSDEEVIRKNNDRIPDMIKVPRGSIVIIKSHSGDIQLDKDAIVNYSRAVAKENEQYVLDPITYIDEITKLFGSVAIYREGDMCPNIRHIPVSDFDKNNKEKDSIILEPSGIVNIPLKEPMSLKESMVYMNSKVRIPKAMTVKEYKEQRNLPSGFRIEDQLKLHLNADSTKNALLEDFTKGIEDKENEEKTMGVVYKEIFDPWVANQESFFKFRPNSITYAFNCRNIQGFEHYVQEDIRLGIKSKNNLKNIINYKVDNRMYANRQRRNEHNESTNISASTQKRSNYTQEKTHLQRYLNAIRKSGTQKYRKIEDPNHKGEFKIVTNPNYVSPITKSALNRQEMQRKPNNSIKVANTRKRVTNMAPQIKQQISETNQRKLGAIALSKINKNSNKEKGILQEYKNVFYNRNIRGLAYKEDLINQLKKLYPGIEKHHFNNIIDRDQYRDQNQYTRLSTIRDAYPNRKNNITKKMKPISNRIVNIDINSINEFNRNSHKELLERILKNNNSRKNNVNKQLTKMNRIAIKKILDSPCPDYEMQVPYKFLYSNKDDPEYKELILKKLDELALCIYKYYEEHMSSTFRNNRFIKYLGLDPVVHSDLINFMLKKHSEAAKNPNNI